MKKILLLAMVFGQSAAWARGGMMYSECIAKANMAFLDFGMTFDHDGSPVYLDKEGQVVFAKKDQVVRNETKDGIQTITYKTEQFKDYGSDEKVMVERTVLIKRDSAGKLMSVSKLADEKQQIEFNKRMNEKSKMDLKFPIRKSENHEFVYDSKGCKINQSYTVQEKDSKEEKLVTYDKEFCDSLMPQMERMGTQNASQCATFISQAQNLFDKRNEQLHKDGKSFTNMGMMGSGGVGLDKKQDTNENRTANFTIGTAVELCTMSAFNPYGMYPGNYGMNPEIMNNNNYPAKGDSIKKTRIKLPAQKSKPTDQ